MTLKSRFKKIGWFFIDKISKDYGRVKELKFMIGSGCIFLLFTLSLSIYNSYLLISNPGTITENLILIGSIIVLLGFTILFSCFCIIFVKDLKNLLELKAFAKKKDRRLENE